MKKVFLYIILFSYLPAASIMIPKYNELHDSPKIAPPIMVGAFKENFQDEVKIVNQPLSYESEYISINSNRPVVMLNGSKDIENKINSKIQGDIDKFIDKIRTQAEQDAKYNKANGYDVVKYIANSDYKVTYNKGNILSIIVDLYSYTGGAHGNTTRISYNFDLNTGNIGTIRDFVGQDVNYNEKIINYIKNEINKNPNMYFKEAITSLNAIPYNQSFYLTDSGIVIYFQEYAIAPYVAGISEFKIPFTIFQYGLNKNVNIVREPIEIKEQTYNKSENGFKEYLSYPVIENVEDKLIEKKINTLVKNDVLNFANKAKEDKNIKSVFTTFNTYQQSENILSIVLTHSANDAEGITNISFDKGYTIDLNTGKVYKLNELFKPGVDYISIINKYIKNEINNLENNLGMKNIYKFQTISPSTEYYLQDGNLVITFPSGEIAPKEYYKPTFNIPLKNLEPYIIENLL